MHGFWRRHGRDDDARWGERSWREHMMRGPRGQGGRDHHHHGRGRRGHGRGVGRLLAHGDLRFLILGLIAEQPRHGYEIIKAIEDSVAGAYSPSPGVVYPTLTLLEELGWARAAEAEGGRKRYEATDEGRAALDANRATLADIEARLGEAREARRRDAHPVIVAAMERLREALFRRALGGPTTDEEAARIAAALDDAAKAIEPGTRD